MSNEIKALDAIKESAGTEQGQYGIDLFTSHHLDEIPKSFWEKHLGNEKPTKEQIIGLLVLRSKWDDEEVYDFTLPDEVTNYVISVSFDGQGEVESIAMES